MKMRILRRRAVAAGLTMLMFLAVSACDKMPESPSDGVYPTPAAGRELVRGICVDPTSSSPSKFSLDVMAELAKQVGNWLPPDKPQDFIEAGPHPGLTLVLRVVATASPTSNDGYSLVVKIPAIPGLPGPPDPQANNFTDLRRQYVAQQQLVRDTRNTAHHAAGAGAETLRKFPLVHENSGVTACASVLALMVGDAVSTMTGWASSPSPGTGASPSSERPGVSFLVASDLDDNEPLQAFGSFNHAPLTLLQTCPSGDLNACQALAGKFEGTMSKLDAGPMTVYRSEFTATTIDTWLEPLA